MIRPLALVFLFVSLATAAGARVPVFVLEPGVYDKIVIDDGEVWLGVFPAGDHAVVRECMLHVRKIKSPDDAEGEATKIEATPGEPLFLLKGTPNVKAGSVKSLYTKAEGVFPDVEVTLRGNRYSLRAVDETASDGFRLRRLILNVDGKQMVLGECPRRDSIYPVWVGDLDGDGRLDVYVRIEHHNYAVEQMLFLSSVDPARKRITARAARLSIRKLE
jgi:hypothetical protein